MGNQAPPENREDPELAALLTYLLAQRSDRVREFLGRHGFRRTGNLAELRSRLGEATRSGVGTAELIAFLDEFEPWGKQHVIFLDGPPGDIRRWGTPNEVARLLGPELEGLLERPVSVLMPPDLTLSSVRLEPGRRLSILAVEARTSLQREEGLDRTEVIDGRDVTFQAYVQVVTRSITALRWNLATNQAYVHITQGPSLFNYEQAYDRLATLIRPWFPINAFGLTNLTPVVAELQRQEERDASIRSHQVRYASRGLREIQVSSATAADSILGEEAVRQAVNLVVGAPGTSGRAGDFYLIGDAEHPLKQEMHISVIAGKSRVNLMRPATEPEVDYVLHRVRSLIPG
jgi:hypothetical protein